MIKREYTYFVAFQAQHTSGDNRQCAITHIVRDKIRRPDDVGRLRESLLAMTINAQVECDKIIITAITLLSSKWVWK